MQADMVALFGGQVAEQIGASPGGGQPQRGERPQAGEGGDIQPPEGFNPPANGERPAMPGGGGGGDMTSDNPMWVEATIEFEGNIWDKCWLCA